MKAIVKLKLATNSLPVIIININVLLGGFIRVAF